MQRRQLASTSRGRVPRLLQERGAPGMLEKQKKSLTIFFLLRQVELASLTLAKPAQVNMCIHPIGSSLTSQADVSYAAEIAKARFKTLWKESCRSSHRNDKPSLKPPGRSMQACIGFGVWGYDAQAAT